MFHWPSCLYLASQPINPDSQGRKRQLLNVLTVFPSNDFWQKGDRSSALSWLRGPQAPGAKLFFLLWLPHRKLFLFQPRLFHQGESRQIGSFSLKVSRCFQGVELVSEEPCLSRPIFVGWSWVTWTHGGMGTSCSAFYCFHQSCYDLLSTRVSSVSDSPILRWFKWEERK